MERDAEAALREAIKLDPSVAWCHGLLASILRCADELSEAEDEIKRALDLDTGSDQIWSELGAIKLRQRQFVEAEDSLRRALKINSNSAFIWGELGFLLERVKKTNDAADAYRHAIRIDDTDWFAWSKLVRLVALVGTKEELLSLSDKFFHQLKRSAKAVSMAAWAVHDAERKELVPFAIDWLHTAMTEVPDRWKLSHPLA